MRRFIVIIVLLLPLLSIAQPGGGNPGGDPDKVPITGVEWLLLAGGLLGARKVYKNFKGHSENS